MDGTESVVIGLTVFYIVVVSLALNACLCRNCFSQLPLAVFADLIPYLVGCGSSSCSPGKGVIKLSVVLEDSNTSCGHCSCNGLVAVWTEILNTVNFGVCHDLVYIFAGGSQLAACCGGRNFVHKLPVLLGVATAVDVITAGTVNFLPADSNGFAVTLGAALDKRCSRESLCSNETADYGVALFVGAERLYFIVIGLARSNGCVCSICHSYSFNKLVSTVLCFTAIELILGSTLYLVPGDFYRLGRSDGNIEVCWLCKVCSAALDSGEYRVSIFILMDSSDFIEILSTCFCALIDKRGALYSLHKSILAVLSRSAVYLICLGAADFLPAKLDLTCIGNICQDDIWLCKVRGTALDYREGRVSTAVIVGSSDFVEVLCAGLSALIDKGGALYGLHNGILAVLACGAVYLICLGTGYFFPAELDLACSINICQSDCRSCEVSCAGHDGGVIRVSKTLLSDGLDFIEILYTDFGVGVSICGLVCSEHKAIIAVSLCAAIYLILFCVCDAVPYDNDFTGICVIFSFCYRGSNRLCSWLRGRLSSWFWGRFCSWFRRRLYGWLRGWLCSWFRGWFLSWLRGWLLGWFRGRFCCWLRGWLLGWLRGWVRGLTFIDVYCSAFNVFVICGKSNCRHRHKADDHSHHNCKDSFDFHKFPPFLFIEILPRRAKHFFVHK